MVLQIVVGLLVANALVNSTFSINFPAPILFIPVVISTAATGVMFGLLLDETIGYIPYVCSALGFPDVTFFRNSSTAMGTVIAMTVWKNFGYTMSILLVGIQGYPKATTRRPGSTALPRCSSFSISPCLVSCRIWDSVYYQPNRRPAGFRPGVRYHPGRSPVFHRDLSLLHL